MAGKGLIAGTGDVHVTAPGVSIPKLKVSGTITVKPSAFNFQEVDGGGFSRNTGNAYIEVEVNDQCDLSLLELQKICGDGAIVSARLVNGKAYALSDAFVIDDIVTSSEGKVTLRFASETSAEEVLGC